MKAVAVGLVAVVIVYAVACWLWPFTACRHCKGTGRRTSPTGKRYGRCRWCKGNPEKIRIGRRVFDYFRGKQRAGRKRK